MFGMAWPGMRAGWEVQAEVPGEDVLFSDQPNMKDTWENVVAAMSLNMYLPISKDKGVHRKKAFAASPSISTWPTFKYGWPNANPPALE